MTLGRWVRVAAAERTYHEGRVICPWHGWVFDVRSGGRLQVPGATLACYATRPTGDDVEIEIDDGDEGTRCRSNERAS